MMSFDSNSAGSFLRGSSDARLDLKFDRSILEC